MKIQHHSLKETGSGFALAFGTMSASVLPAEAQRKRSFCIISYPNSKIRCAKKKRCSILKFLACFGQTCSWRNTPCRFCADASQVPATPRLAGHEAAPNKSLLQHESNTICVAVKLTRLISRYPHDHIWFPILREMDRRIMSQPKEAPQDSQNKR